jgi:signal transduction histidine kinase
LFYNLRRYIFLYYFITVTTFGLGFEYLISSERFDEPILLYFIFFVLVIISGVVISKFSIEPLEEYVTNLEELSRDTLHELNLPIATIRTNVEMVEKNSSDEKTKKRLERIKTACEMLTNRYNELDYLIKKQTKKEIKEVFDLGELVTQRVSFLKGVYFGVEFTLYLDSFVINLDKIGLCKVIDNLIDNGVKYSKQSKHMELALQNGVLSIKDHGIGIDEVVLLRVFDRYYQSDESMPGFGIGLAMVKRFCDTNGIKLSIESKKEQGTTIFLDFKGCEWNIQSL